MKLIVKALVIGTALVMGVSGCAKRGHHRHHGAAGVGDTVRFFGTHISPERERELLSQNTYYFDYDRYDLSEEDLLSVYAHAKRIITHSKSEVRIEGHTDERGSREYNIALGEHRAKAVANALMLKGVNPDRISVVSYGKEKPASVGDNEAAWKLNRRAVIIYERQ